MVPTPSSWPQASARTQECHRQPAPASRGPPAPAARTSGPRRRSSAPAAPRPLASMAAPHPAPPCSRPVSSAGQGCRGLELVPRGVWRRGGTALRQGHRVVRLGAGATGGGASWCSFASAHPCRALQFFEVLLRPLQLGQELAGAGQCQVGPAGKSKGETLRSFVRLPSNTANRVGRGSSDDAGWFCPPPCEHLCITALETRAGTVATVCESEWEEERLGRACQLTSRPWAPTGRSRLRKSTWLLLAVKW